ncbi:1613_t:CDS:2 [Gigaspora margarita]|uniref:1613_t:CDS:1 n=1 Tax=Gigaspora margarita TaxID=4874 RepID=A0ABN7WGH3_GIGMA|nr:1613_t:CDS:2 [Gigaspora margarita]
MRASDLTKPIYHGREEEDIQEFLEDFEYIPWIHELIKTNTAWADLKDTVIASAQASCDTEEKLE